MSKIKDLRLQQNFTIFDIAEKTGFTPSYISNLENGHKNNPTKEVMEKVSAALGHTVQEVFFPEDE